MIFSISSSMTSFTPANFEALTNLVNRLMSDQASLKTEIEELRNEFYDHLNDCTCECCCDHEDSEEISSDIILEYHNPEEEEDEEEDADIPVTIINNTTNNITNILPNESVNEDGSTPLPEQVKVYHTQYDELKQLVNTIKDKLETFHSKLLDLDTSNTEMNCKLNSIITCCGENSGAINRIETLLRERSYQPPVQCPKTGFVTPNRKQHNKKPIKDDKEYEWSSDYDDYEDDFVPKLPPSSKNKPKKDLSKSSKPKHSKKH